VLFDAPPGIGYNLRRAVDQIAAANGVSSTVAHLVYSHHHADHADASCIFGSNVVRVGHEETRRLLLRDDGPARPGRHRRSPSPTDTPLEVRGERAELAWHGPNHSPDNIYIHFPGHGRPGAPLRAARRERLGRGKSHLDTVTAQAAAPIIAKYTGMLAAADIEVFTTTITFAIMQSLRLDRGPGGPVHP
jgi:hypothetical protein